MSSYYFSWKCEEQISKLTPTSRIKDFTSITDEMSFYWYKKAYLRNYEEKIVQFIKKFYFHYKDHQTNLVDYLPIALCSCYLLEKKPIKYQQELLEIMKLLHFTVSSRFDEIIKMCKKKYYRSALKAYTPETVSNLEEDLKITLVSMISNSDSSVAMKKKWKDCFYEYDDIGLLKALSIFQAEKKNIQQLLKSSGADFSITELQKIMLKSLKNVTPENFVEHFSEREIILIDFTMCCHAIMSWEKKNILYWTKALLIFRERKLDVSIAFGILVKHCIEMGKETQLFAMLNLLKTEDQRIYSYSKDKMLKEVQNMNQKITTSQLITFAKNDILISFGDMISTSKKEHRVDNLVQLYSCYSKDLDEPKFKEMLLSVMENSNISLIEFLMFVFNSSGLSEFYEKLNDGKGLLKKLMKNNGKFNIDQKKLSSLDLETKHVESSSNLVPLMYIHVCEYFANRFFSSDHGTHYLKSKHDTSFLYNLTSYKVTYFKVVMFTTALRFQPIKHLRFNPHFGRNSKDSLQVFFDFEKTLKGENKYKEEYEIYSRLIDKKIYSVYREFLNEIKEENLKYSDILLCVKNKGVGILCEAADPTFKSGVFEKFEFKFQKILKNIKKYSSTIKWLNSVNYCQLDFNFIENETLQNLEMTFMNLMDLLKEQQLSDDTIHAITYFCENRSALFDQLSKYYLEQENDMNKVIDETLKFLQAVFVEQNIKLKDIEAKASGVIMALRNSNKSIKQESKIISNFFSAISQDKNFDISKLEDCLIILEYIKAAPELVACLKKYHMKCLTDEMINLSNDIMSKEIMINDISEELKNVKMILKDMKNYHLNFFKKIAEASGFVSFLKDNFNGRNEFEEKTNILMTGLQKNDFEMNVLSDLKKLFDILKLFSSTETSLDEISKTFIKTFPTEDTCEEGLHSLENILLNFNQIRIWFSRTSRLTSENLFFAVKMLKKGNFEVLLNSHPDGPQIRIKYKANENEINESIFSEEELNDFKRSAIFYLTELEKGTDESDSNAEIKDFISCYEIGIQCKDVLFQLEESGHIDYIDPVKSCFLTDSGISIKNLKKKIEKLQEIHQIWKNNLEKLQDIPQLLLLTKFQLIKFMNLCNRIQFESITDQFVNLLLPFIFVCFGNEFSKCFSKIPSDLVKEILLDLKKKKFVDEVEQMKLLIDELQKYIPMTPNFEETEKSEVITCFNSDPMKQLLLMLNVFDVGSISLCQKIEKVDPKEVIPKVRNQLFAPLHQSQIFFCSRKSSISDVHWFHARRKHFQNMKYIVYKVENLLGSVRDELMRLECDEEAEFGKTYYLFTTKRGTDSFSFLKSITFDSENYDSLHEHFFRNIGLWNSEINCVAGKYDLCGKSNYIQREMSSIDCVKIVVPVNEDFSTSKFLFKYQSVKKHSHIGIHFNVSIFGNYEELEKFFFNFFFYGLFIDGNGDIEFPTLDQKFTFFIEIPVRPDNFFKRVPTAKLFSKSIKTIEEKLIINEKSKLVSIFIKCRNNVENSISDIYDNKLLLSDKESIGELDRYFQQSKVSSTVFHQSLFINLMYERCKFLLVIFKYYKNRTEFNINGQEYLLISIPKFYTKSVEFFVQECEVMSNNNIKQDWTNLPISFSLRMKQGDYPTISLIKLNDNDNSYPGYSKENLIKNLALFRSEMSLALGIGDNTNKLWHILKRQKYVLTLDFGTKLLFMNERRKIGVNTILEGETGCGKSELVKIFSEIINCDFDLTPDKERIFYQIFVYLLDAASKIYKKTEEFNFSQFVSDEERKKLMDWLNKNFKEEVQDDKVIKVKLFEDIFQQELYSPNSYISQFLSEQKLEYLFEVLKKIDEKSKNMKDFMFLTLFSKLLFNLIDKMIYEKYPLIEKTSYVKEMIDASKTENFKIQKASQIMTFIEEVYLTAPKNLYFKILMHGQLTIETIRSKINHIIHMHNQTIQKYQNNQINSKNIVSVVFVDELNTCSYPGLMKEIFIDKMMDGKKIPDTIYFIGAINPPTVNADTNDPKYVVKKMPSSMKNIILDFEQLNTEQQKEFAHNLYDEALIEKKSVAKLEKYVLWCQNYILDLKGKNVGSSAELANLENIVPSIRDITRVSTLYNFFTKLKCLKNCDDTTNIIVTIAMSYYFRLPPSLRRNFSEQFEFYVYNHFNERISIEKTMNIELEEFFNVLMKKQQIPKGIAKTQALMENLFCNVICVQAGIPLFITGPPGTSKTLSFNIASRLDESCFSFIKKVHQAHYQCSQYSTSQEIEMVCKGQMKQMENFKKGLFDDIFLVFLDEAGLPKTERHALKVIHYYLDHPKVAFVIISNTILDAAKTSRALQLHQPDSSDNDLINLAMGCLFENQKPSNRDAKIMNGIIDAYKKVNEIIREWMESEDFELFQPRDFIYFLRMITRESPKITPEKVYHSLQRNFNGVPPQYFEKIAKHFFNCINKELDEFTMPLKKDIMSNLSLIKDAIDDRVKENEDPNHAPFRYVMIVDPTETQVALDLLYSQNILEREKSIICSISDFQKDDNSFSKSQVISKIKRAMEEGETVVLVNSMSISSNLYDVFNKHFSIVPTKEGNKYYANVAIGAYSRKCQVHQNFQLIVHIPLSEYKKAPLPFLNRFEKYIFGYESVFEPKFDHMMDKKELATLIENGVKDFVKLFTPETFYGYKDTETVKSLLINVFNQDSDVPLIPSPFKIENNFQLIDAEDYDLRNENPKARVREFIRKCNYILLQIARPDSIYLQKEYLPSAYLHQYLCQQEHLSVVNFLKSAFLKKEESYKKWVIYTRSSGKIGLLQSNVELQKEIIEDPNELKVLDIASIDSQEQCDIEIENFFRSKKGCLMCLCDVGRVKRDQFNYFKTMFDEKYEKRKSNVTVCIVIHFSSEIQRKSVYDTIYLNHWNFVYIDSYKPTPKELQIDSRWWFMTASNLDQINPKELEIQIEEPLNAVLNESIGFFSITHLDIRKDAGLKLQFQNFMKQFKNEKYLKEIVCSYFNSSWLSEYLSMIVEEISKNVISGFSVDGIIDLIQFSLENKLGSIIMKFMDIVVKQMKNISENKLIAPNEKKIVKDILLHYLNNTTVNIAWDDHFISKYLIVEEKFPCFSVVDGLIKKYYSDAEKITFKYESLETSFSKIILKDDELCSILTKIENDDDLFAKFQHTFIDFYFHEFGEIFSWLYSIAKGKKTSIFSIYQFMHENHQNIKLIECHFLAFGNDEILKRFEELFEDVRDFDELIPSLFKQMIRTAYSQVKFADDDFSIWSEKVQKIKFVISPKNIEYLDRKTFNIANYIIILSNYFEIFQKIPHSIEYEIDSLHSKFDDILCNLISQNDDQSKVGEFLTCCLLDILENVLFDEVQYTKHFLLICNRKDLKVWNLVSISYFAYVFDHLGVYKNHRDLLELELRNVKETDETYLIHIVKGYLLNMNMGVELKDYLKMKPMNTLSKLEHKFMNKSIINTFKTIIESDKTSIEDYVNDLTQEKFENSKEFFSVQENIKFLIGEINMEEKLLKLLKTKDSKVIEMFNLENYLLDDSFLITHNFPFMKDDIYLKFQKSFKSKDELIKLIKDQCTNDEEMFKIRMFLVLICYHDFFFENQECPVLRDVLQNQEIVQKLKIVDLEMKAYEFYFNGPLDVPKNEPMIGQFSKKKFEDKKNSDFEWNHILVNITAICLGLPKEKNHMYYRAFLPEYLYNSSGPGNINNGLFNWDCGYQLSFDQQGNEIIPNFTAPHILNGNMLHHSALNSLTFGAFYLMDNHMCNTLDIDKPDILKDFPNPTRDQCIRWTFHKRFAVFYSVFSNIERDKYATSPLLFMTISLYYFWKEAPKSNDAKGHFPQTTNGVPVRNYENFIRDYCFDPTNKNIKQIKEGLQERSKRFKEIEIWREQYKEKQSQTIQPFQSYRMFNDQFSLKCEENATLDQESNEYIVSNNIIESLSEFEKYKKKLDMIQDLPRICNFYLKLLKETNYRYTSEEIRTMTIEDVIKNTKEKITIQELDEFLELWGKNTAELQAEVCNQQEMFFAELTKKSEFYTFLNIEGEEKGILKWIEEICQVHNRFAEGKTSINVEDLSDHPNYSIIVPYFQTLIPRIIQSNKYDLQNSSVYYDWNFINRLLINTLKKYRIQINPGNIKNNYFKFKVDNNEIKVDHRKELKELTQNQIIFRLLQWSVKNENNQFYTRERMDGFSATIRQKTKEEILKICEFLERFVFLVNQKDHQNTNFNEIIKSKKLKNAKFYSKHIDKMIWYKVHQLFSIIEICRNAYFESDHQFSVLGLSLTERIPNEIECDLNQLKNQILKDSNYWSENYKLFSSFAEILSSKNLVNKFHDPMIQIESLKSTIQKLKLEKFIQLDLNTWLPNDISVDMYENYMRIIIRIIGSIHLSIISSSKKHYIEKVPDDYVKQATLSNEDPISQNSKSSNEKEESEKNELESDIIEENIVEENDNVEVEDVIEKLDEFEEIVEIIKTNENEKETQHFAVPKNQVEKVVQEPKETEDDQEANPVAEFLNSIKLGEYVDNFMDQGYDDLDFLIEEGLTDEDFELIGISKPGHINKITKKLQKMKK
eukprot:gene8967-916_t